MLRRMSEILRGHQSKVSERESPEIMSDERHRLVVLGSSKVGKTAILKRYLENSFSERYKETVEDVFQKDLNIKGQKLLLDFVDTSFHYPDMRRLLLPSASAFLIVLGVDNVVSFKHASDLLQEIIESRGCEIANLPIVVAGNNVDLEEIKITRQTAEVWLLQTCASTVKSSIPYVECSAKTGQGVSEVFKTLLAESGFAERRAKAALLATNSLGISSDVKRTRSFRGRPAKKTNVEKLANEEPMTRHGSLMRRGAARMSFKKREVKDAPKDDSDCHIS